MMLQETLVSWRWRGRQAHPDSRQILTVCKLVVHCKNEAQKSPLFWRFSGGLWFSQDRLCSRNSTRKPLNLIKSRIFTNAPCKTACLYNAPSMHTLEDIFRGPFSWWSVVRRSFAQGLLAWTSQLPLPRLIHSNMHWPSLWLPFQPSEVIRDSEGTDGQRTERVKTGHVKTDRFRGHFRGHFHGHPRGRFRGAFRGESSTGWHRQVNVLGPLVGTLAGALVGAFVGPLVGILVDPLVGSNFAVRVLCACQNWGHRSACPHLSNGEALPCPVASHPLTIVPLVLRCPGTLWTEFPDKDATKALRSLFSASLRTVTSLN